TAWPGCRRRGRGLRLASMTRMRIGPWSVLERVGRRAEQRIACVLGSLPTLGDRQALVGRQVGAGFLLAPADQLAVIARAGEDAVDLILVVEDPELLPLVEPPGVTRRAQRGPDPCQRSEHVATFGGTDVAIGPAIVQRLLDRDHLGLEFRWTGV